MKLASAGDFSAEGGKVYFQTHIYFKFFLQSFFDLPGSYKFSVLTGKGRIVDQEIKRDGRLVDRNRGQGNFILVASNSFSNVDIRNTGDDDNISGRDFRHIFSGHPFESEKFCYLCFARFISYSFFNKNLLAGFYLAAVYADDRQPAQEIVVSQVKNLSHKIIFCLS